MFGGFKARLNFFGKNRKGMQSELSPDMTVSGAYRTSRDDFFGYYNSFDQPKRTASSDQVFEQMRPTKSVSDLTKTKNMAPNLRHSTTEVSQDPRGAEQSHTRNGAQNIKTKPQEKEQKKLEKQRQAEQKAREKKAAQEQAKQDKLNKEREKMEAQTKAKKERKPVKKQAPKPQAPLPGTVAQPPQPGTVAQSDTRYSTNTLESSISKSSGPPPYSDVPKEPERPERTKKSSQARNSGNVSYSKPEDTGSWDMISQHRQQMIRPTTTVGGGEKRKQMVMDLNYNFDNTSQVKDNSDA